MNPNDILELQKPFIEDDSIRSVNFFNGRLLTSKDFSREQEARRVADWRFGLALGEGVSFGLQIEPNKQLSQTASPVVNVKAGLAFNSKGQALRLTNDVQVALVRSLEATTSLDCLFKNCEKLIGGTYIAGAGVYVLTIAPAEMSEGKAATNGLDPSNVRCNTDALVEAVQFRLLKIKRELYDLDESTPSFRNELVYRCFGAGIQPAWFENLLNTTPRQDDLLETLRQKNVLSPLEVPLGLLFFTGSAKLEFIDLWAVRRPLSRTSEPFASLVDERRLAVGQAMFQQFQTQIAELSAKADFATVSAQTHFRYLPPVGIIPVAEETNLSDAQATKFFTGMTYRSPVFINAARIESLIRESLSYPPIDTQTIDPKTNEKDPRKGEMLWLYRVRENRMAIDFAGSTPVPRSYLIFASGHLPYIGDAQFNLARWNYSNFTR